MKTLTEKSAGEQQKDYYNRHMRESSDPVVVDLSEKLAVVLLRLHSEVSQPGDYTDFRDDIEAIDGIQTVELLVDGQCPASIIAGHELRLVTDVQMRIESTGS